MKGLDLMRGLIDVVEALPDYATEPGTPKSHKSRTVPIPRSVISDLAALVAMRGPEELVFMNSTGGVLDNTNFRRNVFTPSVRALGPEPLTPHDLRHTTASLAVSAGGNVKAVQRLLGHASAAMTLGIYPGLFSDNLDVVAERLHEAAASDRLHCGDQQQSKVLVATLRTMLTNRLTGTTEATGTTATNI